MAMNIWLSQEQALRKTFWMLVAFAALTLAVAIIADYCVRSFWFEYQYASLPWVAIGFIGITLLAALYNYAQYQSQGGSYVAEMLGAVPVSRNTQNPTEKQLINLVEELCLASRMPMPAVYILENDQINAFAAGLVPENACITVTTGALHKLNRSELQAVLAHEFGHIFHGDMKLSLRLSALLMGFFIIFYMALRLMQFRPRTNGRNSPVALIALVLIAAGALSWFAGKVLSAMISRQREFLADASSAQFTRNPEALVGALQKIERDTAAPPMPASGMAYSHLYFENRGWLTSLFATHPPIEKRIEALLGKTYLD